MAKSIDDHFDDIPLDDVCAIVQEQLIQARDFQSRGAILNGERSIDQQYTKLRNETLEYFHNLPSQKKMAVLAIFVSQYGKKD